jgi:hypothetical protein
LEVIQAVVQHLLPSPLEALSEGFVVAAMTQLSVCAYIRLRRVLTLTTRFLALNYFVGNRAGVLLMSAKEIHAVTFSGAGAQRKDSSCASSPGLSMGRRRFSLHETHRSSNVGEMVQHGSPPKEKRLPTVTTHPLTFFTGEPWM